ncbi:MAG: hypothetical protein N3D20_00820 [Candidatus Pacearchaeota archaeon]|nr:hypothetical protein [Candidatus Pacearchaeota archaeon]
MPKGQKKEDLNATVLENLIQLQKLYADLAENFAKTSQKLDSLINLFESTAKSFASQPQSEENERQKEITNMLNQILEQDKIIAKGITIIEEKIGAIPPQSETPPIPASPIEKPLPKF